MENNDLQKLWKGINTQINEKSKEELNLLLASKTRQIMGRFLFIIGISVFVSLGLLIFLIVTSLNRQNDLIYLINNILLGMITILSLFSGILSWQKLQNKDYDLALKAWLEVRISLLSNWLKGKYSRLYIFLIPLIYALTVLSIHVYFENQLFMQVLKTEESLVGLIVGIPVGLYVSYFAIRKIRRYELNNLEFLEDLYKRLCDL